LNYQLKKDFKIEIFLKISRFKNLFTDKNIGKIKLSLKFKKPKIKNRNEVTAAKKKKRWKVSQQS
jgi:hypothetical protein